MVLQLRPNCEYCDKDLLPASTDARICSYECTFCADCAENRLHNVCPNCGGGFVPRPIRPAKEWRPGLSVAKRRRRTSGCTYPTVSTRSRSVRRASGIFRQRSDERSSRHSGAMRSIEPESRDSGFIAARCPGMTQKVQTARLPPVRIEPFFQSLPAIGVVVLQRRGVGRMRGDVLRVSGLEHERHGAGQLDRLQLRIAGMFERLAVGAVR